MQGVVHGCFSDFDLPVQFEVLNVLHLAKSRSLHEEVELDTLAKIPSGITYLNLTVGEPTLRQDLMDIVDLLHPKAMKLEISSNGLHPERLEPVIRKYPDIKIRFSLEGRRDQQPHPRRKRRLQYQSQRLTTLQELGGTDLGFAITIQDDNVQDLVDLFQFAEQNHFELATSALHNRFQFHKSDNIPYDRLHVARQIEGLITAQLRTNNIKNWFRAYLNLGLIAKVLGHDRLLPCTAATDFMFIDPWSDVYACNVRPDLKVGNLRIKVGMKSILARKHRMSAARYTNVHKIAGWSGRRKLQCAIRSLPNYQNLDRWHG